MKRNPENKVQVMKESSSSAQIKACRAFALERNRLMFEEAQDLNRAAHDLLDGSHLDVELFVRYQAMRRKADLKFEEAIEHLQLLNEDFPPIPMSAHHAENLRPQYEFHA